MREPSPLVRVPVGGVMGFGDQNDRSFWVRCAQEALAQVDPEERIEHFLHYLEAFPLGANNRRAAESIERLLYLVGDARQQDELRNRLRSLRDPHLPPVEPGTWGED